MKNILSSSVLKTLILFSLSSFVVSCGSDLPSQDLFLIDSQETVSSLAKQKTDSRKEQIEHGIYQCVVTKLLPDDLNGLKHQQFMIKIVSPKYLNKIAKVAHNIDQAPKIPVQVGSTLEIKGDLIVSATPDMVLHWTHRSDDDSHPDGYIRLNDRVYN